MMYWILAALLAQDSYRIQLSVESDEKDADRFANTVRRGFAELPGIREMKLDERRVVLSMEIGTLLSRVEIEDQLPRTYRIAKYEISHLVGTVYKGSERVSLAIAGVDWKITLKPTEKTQDWFDAADEPMGKDDGWALSGVVEERVVRQGGRLGIEWTVYASAAEKSKIPDSPAQRALQQNKQAAVKLRVFLEDLQDGLDSGVSAAAAVKRVGGVVDAEWDPFGMMLLIYLDPEGKIDVEGLRASVREHAIASRILIDGLTGTIHSAASGPYFKTAPGMNFRIEGKTEAAREIVRGSAKMFEKPLYSVAGEIILVEDKILILARSVRLRT